MAAMEFDNFEALAMHLRAASRATTPALQKAVQAAVQLVADSASDSIGPGGTISGEAVGLAGIVGTHDPTAPDRELGTPTMPPRPSMGAAGEVNEIAIQHLMLDAVVGALISRRNAR